MAIVRLRYVNKFTDRHGTVRIYYRPPGCSGTPLPGPVGSPAFMEAYNAAIAAARPRSKAGLPIKTGTLAALAISYFNSTGFNEKRAETKRSEPGIINRLVEKYGRGLVDKLEPGDVQRIIDKKAGTPSAARNLLNAFRVLGAHAIKLGWRTTDPTVGVTRPKIRTPGYKTWDEDHIAAYRKRYSIGSRERLAIELLLNTGQRRGDVVLMGCQHVSDGILYVRQEKTGAEVFIPILPSLKAAIDALPERNMTFLVTADGKPYTAAGFGNWFRDCCRGVPNLPKGLSAHGLRKATCRRLAEAGRSANEIAAITGHRTLRMVARYTEAADWRRMASAAMAGMYKSFEEHPGTGDLQTWKQNLQTPLKGKAK